MNHLTSQQISLALTRLSLFVDYFCPEFTESVAFPLMRKGICVQSFPSDDDHKRMRKIRNPTSGTLAKFDLPPLGYVVDHTQKCVRPPRSFHPRAFGSFDKSSGGKIFPFCRIITWSDEKSGRTWPASQQPRTRCDSPDELCCRVQGAGRAARAPVVAALVD